MEDLYQRKTVLTFSHLLLLQLVLNSYSQSLPKSIIDIPGNQVPGTVATFWLHLDPTCQSILPPPRIRPFNGEYNVACEQYTVRNLKHEKMNVERLDIQLRQPLVLKDPNKRKCFGQLVVHCSAKSHGYGDDFIIPTLLHTMIHLIIVLSIHY